MVGRSLLFVLVLLSCSIAVPAATKLSPSDAGYRQSGPLPTRRSPSTITGHKYVAGQLIVRFGSGIHPAVARAAHASIGAQVLRTYEHVSGLQLVQLPKNVGIAEGIRAYRTRSEVLTAEPNYVVSVDDTVPNDTSFADQWGLFNSGALGGVTRADIHAREAWDLSTGSSTVVVATIDTGVDYTHPDLVANIYQSPTDCNKDGIDNDGDGYIDDCYGINTLGASGVTGINASDPMDDNGHGTHVAGIIGAIGNNSLGVAGLNWQVKILPCKFLDQYGQGTVAGALACLNWIIKLKQSGVNIVATNNSYGAANWSFSEAMQTAIDVQRQNGILFIAAAGNSFSDNDVSPAFPANYEIPNVISVGATNRADERAFFSNWGQHTVSLGAPGEDILSTLPGGSYGYDTGTSMAAPFVTGLAALLKAQEPTRDWRAIKNLILAGGDVAPSLSQTLTSKRMNAYGSMACTSQPQYARMLPTASVIAGSVGVPVALSALNINCGAPAGAVQVTVQPGGEVIGLVDDGTGADLAANDGVYTATFVPAATGQYSLIFPNGDSVALQVLQPYSVQPVPSQYVSISGTNLNLSDDSAALITSPFAIPFGNGSFTQLWVSANGTVSFSDAFSGFDHQMLPMDPGALLPSPYHEVTLIAPFWDDLEPVAGTARNAFWAVTGSVPNRQLVVEWRDVPAYDCPSGAGITFEVVFNEGKSDVLFNYAQTQFGGACFAHDFAGAATVGIQTGPQAGAIWSINSEDVSSSTSLLWQTSSNSVQNPAPIVSSFSPASAPAFSPGVVVTINGGNFVPGSRVQRGLDDRPTTFISSTQLQVLLTSADLDPFQLGVPQQQLTVINPGPGGGSFYAGVFTMTPVAPVISALSPSAVAVGSFSFQLHVTGSNFMPNAIVQWAGVPLLSFSSRTEAVGLISVPQLLATAQAVQVTVSNGPGTVSNALTFNVAPPASATASSTASLRQLITQSNPLLTGAASPPMRASPPAPLVFRGWADAQHRGPEFLDHFVRPYGRSALSQIGSGNSSLSGVASAGASGSGALAGFALRSSTTAGYLPSSVVAGDFNRDGNMDFAVANAGNNSVWIYFGRGDGTTAPPAIINLSGQTPIALAAADLRGNGILDLVVGQVDSSTIGVLLGNGDGTFAPEFDYFVPNAPLALAVADFTGDGQLDIAVAGAAPDLSMGPFVVLPGDGKGHLLAPLYNPSQFGAFASYGMAIAAADLNNDGRPDLVVSDLLGGNGGVFAYLNTGDGTFKTTSTAVFENLDLFLVSLTYQTVALGDLNHDGCADLVTTTSLTTADVALGNCDGTFRHAASNDSFGQGDYPWGIMLADLDGDGNLDLVTSGVNINAGLTFGQQAGSLITVQYGDGTGKFLNARVYRGDSTLISIAAADLHGTGHPDIVAASQDSDSANIFLNDGKGGFDGPQGNYIGWITAGSDNSVSNAASAPLLVSDVNGDGKPDLFVMEIGRVFPEPFNATVMLNDGTGHFSAPVKSPVWDGSLLARLGDYALGDFRHTGQQDLVVVGLNLSFSFGVSQYAFAANVGGASFAMPMTVSVAGANGLVATGDFNGDGNLDFVVAGDGGTNTSTGTQSVRSFLGHGDGAFTPSTQQLFGGNTLLRWPRAIYAGDFNGDGKQDVLIWLYVNTVPGQNNDVFECLGNGDGSFQPCRVVLPNLKFFNVADVNGDGRPDVIEQTGSPDTQIPPGVAQYNVYLAQSDGSFTLSQSYSPYSDISVEPYGGKFGAGNFVGDVNGDGIVDIVAFGGSALGLGAHVMLGNGDGSFMPTYSPIQLGTSHGYVGGDTNGDGRADVVELDSFASSFHVITANAGPAFQVAFLAQPLLGNAGKIRVLLAKPSSEATAVQLASSDPNIVIASSATIPAGSLTVDVPFQLGANFDISHGFTITGQLNNESESVTGWATIPGRGVGVRLSTESAKQVVLAGQKSNDYQGLVISLGGYSSTLDLSCAGLPPGFDCQLGQGQAILAPGASIFDSLYVQTPASASIGDVKFSLSATDGAITQTVPLTLSVGDFSIAFSSGQSNMALPQLSFTNFNVALSSVNNWNGTVQLSTSGLPAGALPNLGFAGAPSQFQLQLTVQGVTAGRYPFTLTAIAGGVSRSASSVLVVSDFSGIVSPANASIKLGQSATFTVSGTTQFWTNAQIQLSCATATIAVNCTFNPSAVTVDSNGNFTAVLTVTPQTTSQALYKELHSLVALWSVLPALIWIPSRRRFCKIVRRAAVIASLMLAIALLACGGGSGGSSSTGGGGSGGLGGGASTTASIVVSGSVSGVAYSKPLGTITLTMSQ